MDHYLRTTYPQLRNQIIPEDRSTSTAQNLLYLQIVLKQDLSLHDLIAIVTNGFHTPHARAIAQHEGYQHVINLSAAIPLCIRYHFSLLVRRIVGVDEWLFNGYEGLFKINSNVNGSAAATADPDF